MIDRNRNRNRNPGDASAGVSAVALASTSVEQTIALGRAVGRLARAGDVIALEGELGAGKTQFVRGLAEGMGLDAEAVSSPTFVLMHEYLPENDDGRHPALVHIDAYRIDGGGDLQTLGWEEGGPGELAENAVVVVEWASRIERDLPADALRVEIRHEGEASRSIEISGSLGWRGRWDALRAAIA